MPGGDRLQAIIAWFEQVNPDNVLPSHQANFWGGTAVVILAAMVFASYGFVLVLRGLDWGLDVLTWLMMPLMEWVHKRLTGRGLGPRIKPPLRIPSIPWYANMLVLILVICYWLGSLVITSAPKY